MNSIGHPIVGDRLYNKILKRTLQKKNNINDIMQSSRLFLHSNSITFEDMFGNNISVEDHLPDDLLKIVNFLEIETN